MTLDDICEAIVDCEHKTAPTQAEGYPSIRTPNIGRGHFLLDGVNRVSEETYQLWTKRAVPRAGDLIMAREAPVGNVAMIPPGLEPCLGQRTLLIRPDHKRADARYLTYLLLGPEVQATIHARTNGATVPHLNMVDVRDLNLPALPSLPVQRRIASILSTYDDLIGNCERRIRVLDEMARALYREWFVQFRYPDHERDKAPAGLPNGWQRVPISQVYAALYDGPHATPPPSNEGPVFLGIGNITETGRLDLSEVRHIAEEDYPRWTKRATPQLGDIVFTYEATLHRYAMIPGGFRGCLGRRLALIRPDPAKRNGRFLFFTLLSEGWREVVTKNILAGATVDRIPLSKVPAFPITLPPTPLVVRFDETVRPFVDEQAHLGELKTNLRKTRDLLLPRLLSGKLDICDLGEVA